MEKRPIRWGRGVVAGSLACTLAIAQSPFAWAQAPTTKAAAGASAAGTFGVSTTGATPATAAAAASTTSGKTDLVAAKKHYGEGEKKYKASDFAGALADFEQANEIKPTPQAERYLGLCEDALGHYQAADAWYDKFLTHVPDKLTAQGDEIRKRATEINAMPGKVHVDSTPQGATVTADDKPLPGVTPLDVDLPPGTHTLKLTEGGHLPSTKTVDVAFASTQTLTVELEAEPPPPPPPTPVAAAVPVAAPASAPAPAAEEPHSIVPALVTGGLALAAAGVGTVFGIIALGDKSDFDKNPTTSTADSGDTHALIADMAFGVAVTFGVTSAVLFLTKDETPAAAATSSTSTSSGSARADGFDAKASRKTAVTFVPTPIVGPHLTGAGFVLRY